MKNLFKETCANCGEVREKHSSSRIRSMRCPTLYSRYEPDQKTKAFLCIQNEMDLKKEQLEYASWKKFFTCIYKGTP